MAIFRKLSDEEQQKLGLANLDVLLSTRASEATLLSVLDQVAKDNTLEQIVEALGTLETSNTEVSDSINTTTSYYSEKTNKSLDNIWEAIMETNKLLRKIANHR